MDQEYLLFCKPVEMCGSPDSFLVGGMPKQCVLKVDCPGQLLGREEQVYRSGGVILKVCIQCVLLDIYSIACQIRNKLVLYW